MSRRTRTQNHTDGEEKQWELTFTDMLTLLLTFFIFIIAVSTFKTTEYKRFWSNVEQNRRIAGVGGKHPPTQSLKFSPIKSLRLPWLTSDAEILLNSLEETFTRGDFVFRGVDVNYNENKITLAVSEQISFGAGQYRLNEKVKPLLLKLIPILQASPFNVGVEGHTDEPKAGMELSLNRALAVARFLIQKGLDKNKVSVSGYGPYRPIADNRLPEERRRNRRVEINIIINND